MKNFQKNRVLIGYLLIFITVSVVIIFASTQSQKEFRQQTNDVRVDNLYNIRKSYIT